MLLHPAVTVFSKSLTGDGHLVTRHKSVFDQIVNDRRGATNGIDVFHDILTTGLKVGEQRHSIGDRLEIVNGKVDTDRASDGNQMENNVGRSTKRHGKSLDMSACLFDVTHHRIFESLPGHDLSREKVVFQNFAHSFANSVTFRVLFRIFRRER